MSEKVRKIPPGYKRTEIGIIPEDWEVKKLGEVAIDLIRGPFGSSLRKEFFVKRGYKVYTQENAIYKNIELGKYYISDEKYKELKRFSIKPGDFILSCSGTIGKIFKIPSRYKEGIINQALLIMRINNSIIDEGFFYHYFLWDDFQYKIIDNTQGGAMQNLIGINQFKNTRVPLPLLPEQRAIARVLSDFDELIESLDKLIEKKKAIKKGAMQELLTGKKRLPGFSGKWVIKKLGEILQYEQPTKYIVKSTDYLKIGFVPVLTPGKTFVLGYTDEIEGIYKDIPVIIFDDFTTASKYVDFPFKVKSSAMKMLKLKNKNYDLKFIYEKMQSIDYQINEGDHKRRWIAEYQNIEISLPPTLEEQRAIAQILSDMDEEIEALEKKKEKYKMLKKGAMELLLTGKVRLKVSNFKKGGNNR